MNRMQASNQDVTNRESRRRGSIIVLSAFMIILLLAVVAFSVDLGFISMNKSQLQNAADAAALASATVLDHTPVGDENRFETARDFAVNIAEDNQPGYGELLKNADISFGTWDDSTKTFTSIDTVANPIANPNAVQIDVKRTGASSNQVPLFFGKALGFSEVDVTASSVAVIGEDDPRDIMLVVDCSGSMQWHGRMPAVKDALYVLADELLTTDRLGLAVYSYVDNGVTTGHLERSLDLNHSLVLDRIPDLEPGMYTAWTNIAGGMRVAIEEFAWNNRVPSDGVSKVMVLLTDGHANRAEAPETSPTQSIVYYAALALAADIQIHSIAVGNNADTNWIKQAAESTGGTFYDVEDGDFDKLNEVFREIGRGSGRARIVH